MAKISWSHKLLKDVFLKKTSTSEIEALKVQSCKLKQHWKMIAYMFQ